MSTPASPHVMVVEAGLRRAMVRELWWRDVKAMRGRLLTAAWLGWLAGAIVATGRVGLLVGAAAVLVVALWQWFLVRRIVGQRLPTGQQVTVAVSGDTLAIHHRDDVWLPRGSVNSVERVGTATVLFGRTVFTIVPSAALTDAHAAFLEGHGGIPEEPAEPATPAGSGCDVTPEVVATLDRARRRSYLRSGVMGAHVFAGVLCGGLGLAVAVGAHAPGFLALLAVPALDALVVVSDLRRGSRALAIAHPIGSRLAVHVDDEGLQVTRAHGSVRTPWPSWQAVRVRPETVELRTRPGRPLSNLTLPATLLGADELEVVRRAVGRAF